MAFVKEHVLFMNLVRCYHLGEIKTDEDAVLWVDKIRNMPDIVPRHIKLEDTARRSDEGSQSVELDGDISPEVLRGTFKGVDVDYIILSGTFRDEPVTISAALYGAHGVGITVRRDRKNEYKAYSTLEELETYLGLL